MRKSVVLSWVSHFNCQQLSLSSTCQVQRLWGQTLQIHKSCHSNTDGSRPLRSLSSDHFRVTWPLNRSERVQVTRLLTRPKGPSRVSLAYPGHESESQGPNRQEVRLRNVAVPAGSAWNVAESHAAKCLMKNSGKKLPVGSCFILIQHIKALQEVRSISRAKQFE